MQRSVTSAWIGLVPAAAACVLAQGAWAQTRELATRGELLDRVVAIVNDGVVLNSDLDEQVEVVSDRLRQQKLELPPQNVLRQQVLERLVVQEIQLQRANHAGVKVTDEMLNAALQDVAKRNSLTLSQLPDALAKQGVDYPSYRDDIRREITITLLRQRDVLQHISVTPREIDQFLEKQARTPSERNEYNVSHILIAVGQEASPAQLEAAAKRAQEVYTRAKGGEDFAKLAVAYSNSQTALDGGALGWRKGSELPTFLTESIAKLKPGEVSEPLRTPTGYHIIRLNEVRGGTENAVEDQVHVRHILMKTTELADDATVRSKLEALRERILKGEEFAGIAQVSSEDPGSAAEGGDLGWTGPGTFAPEFEQAIGRLKDNEISEPFKTQFGWHIAQMLGHRRYDNSDELKRRQAMEAIRASKADEETELWLRRMRDEAYVEYKS
ncbi:MAG TPA: peptidylprolyl isomerase [Steroidobacteraceae bacterium]|jgi:peptidyl-prolyl cis-trans isomerase SurA|nr:peptidylprolyl isomerase [Steroidobacteraceae bacterium]